MKRVNFQKKLFCSGLSVLFFCLATSLMPLSVAARSKAIDPAVLQMVQKIAYNPELMNVSYLQYLIGFPENGRAQQGLIRKGYTWYEEPSRFAAYTLEQQGPSPGVVTRSMFSINVPNSEIRMKDVEEQFGPMHKTVYDQQSHPNQIYSISPTTSLIFVQPRNSFRVSSIKIAYAGPPLGPPSQEDMELAYNYRRTQAIGAGQNGDWHKAIPWLRADVAKEPNNPDAHIKLAFAYRQHMMLNESIKEYIEVLKLSGDRPELSSAAIAALTELRVWPLQPAGTQSSPGGGTYIAGSNDNLGL